MEEEKGVELLTETGHEVMNNQQPDVAMAVGNPGVTFNQPVEKNVVLGVNPVNVIPPENTFNPNIVGNPTMVASTIEQPTGNKKNIIIIIIVLAVLLSGVGLYFALFNKGGEQKKTPPPVEKPKEVKTHATATFDKNGADTISIGSLECEFEDGSCIVIAPTIEREGYAILGWATRKDGAGNIIVAGEEIVLTDDVTYYATTLLVEPDVIKFTATFNKNGATSIGATELSCETIDEFCTLKAPSITRSGQNIIGWSTSNSGANIVRVGENITLTRNTTYYAITEAPVRTINEGSLSTEPAPTPNPDEKQRTYTVTFERNGATSIGITKLSCTTTGTSCTVKAPPITRSKHDIVGWSRSSGGGSNIKVGSNITLTRNATYYAITRPSEKTFTATFNKNGASSIGATRLSCKTRGNYCTVTAPSITRSGHDIWGWATNKNGTHPMKTGNTITLTGNTTYYAITTPIKNRTIIAVFNANGSDTIGAQAKICRTAGNSCTVNAPTIERQGYDVRGWSGNRIGDDNIVKVGRKITLTKDSLFFASTSRTFTATFDKNGADTIATKSANCTTTVESCTVKAPRIVRERYIVIGWSTNPSGTDPIKVGEDLVLTESVTYYAITEITFTATFERNGATTIGTNTLSCTTSGTSCTVTAPSVVRTGWYIHGWASKHNETDKTKYTAVGEGLVLSSNSIYYAITQEPPTFIATLNGNGAGNFNNVSCTATVENMTSCTASLPTISRNNWESHGWAPSTGERRKFANGSIELTEDTTLYAMTSRRLNVTFDRNNHSSIDSNIAMSCTLWGTSDRCNIQAPVREGIVFWSLNPRNNSNGVNPGATFAMTTSEPTRTYYAR